MSCNKKNPCGCGDKALTTPTPCAPGTPCAGETCAEIQCMDCVAYCQDSIVFNVQGVDFEIERGERLMTTIQKLLAFMNDPACADRVATDVVGISKTDTSITIGWNPGNDLYVVEWAGGNANGESPVQSSTTTQYKIENLVSNTEYTIHVRNEADTCKSVTIKITTL